MQNFKSFQSFVFILQLLILRFSILILTYCSTYHAHYQSVLGTSLPNLFELLGDPPTLPGFIFYSIPGLCAVCVLITNFTKLLSTFSYIFLSLSLFIDCIHTIGFSFITIHHFYVITFQCHNSFPCYTKLFITFMRPLIVFEICFRC